jgi:hypothetical protein
MGKRIKASQLSELERLTLFVEVAESLGESTYANNPTGGRLNLHWNKESGFLNTHENKADIDHLRSFLADFRKFTLNDDPVHFYSICNILLRRLPEGELREFVDRSRSIVRGALNVPKFGIGFGKPKEDLAINPMAEIEGEDIKPERILDLWINTIFHTEPDKKKELDNLIASFGGIPEYTFVDTVNVITNQIGIVRGVIKEALEIDPPLFLS